MDPTAVAWTPSIAQIIPQQQQQQQPQGALREMPPPPPPAAAGGSVPASSRGDLLAGLSRGTGNLKPSRAASGPPPPPPGPPAPPAPPPQAPPAPQQPQLTVPSGAKLEAGAVEPAIGLALCYDLKDEDAFKVARFALQACTDAVVVGDRRGVLTYAYARSMGSPTLRIHLSEVFADKQAQATHLTEHEGENIVSRPGDVAPHHHHPSSRYTQTARARICPLASQLRYI